MYTNYVKRFCDIIFAAIILFLSVPILIVTAIAIKLSSPGPIIFKQQRMGQDSIPFNLYKFRSMRIDTPEVASNSLDGGDYYTGIGRIIRKLSIDELPQLVNVLKGDMSIIGPRPVILSETNLLRLRQVNGADQVRPGITGLAQVNGRDQVTDEPKAAWDAQYARTVSWRLDVQIFIHTLISVLKSDGVVEDKIKE